MSKVNKEETNVLIDKLADWLAIMRDQKREMEARILSAERNMDRSSQ
jgi:hypothetical protein